MFPKVTVIISTYNRANMLAEALDSVLKQSFKDFEVIVADDASTDATPETLEKYYEQFTKRGISFKAIRLVENSGYQCVPKNMAIYAARGDYIAYLDDDNLWHPDHLVKLYQPFIENLELDLTYCWRKYEMMGHKGLEIDPHPPEWDKARDIILFAGNCIDTSDIMHSRGLAYLTHQNYACIWNENERRFGDHALLKRFIMSGCRGKLVPEELTTYRWHGGNLMITRPVGEGFAPMDIDKYAWHEKKQRESQSTH